MAQEDVNLQHGGTDSRIEMHEQRPRDFLVVGIGASAGGIPALSEFFRNVPADSGMAYVVILHLSPDYDSQLAAVLQGVARIPVTQVTERVRVEPDHVYVISPDRHLSMVKDEIEVADNTRVEERRAPVDIFFRTLGESLGPRAVCVVLSGTGANGSMGLKRVKEMGGAAFVQRPREAAFDEMPRRSIATGLVDDILDAAHIPDAVLRYRDHRMRLRIDEEIEERPPDQEALREIFTLVRVRTGHDFSNYKRPTLLRRIERRMGVRNCLDLAAYVRFLHDSPDETESLLRDLLISVTGFFRDAKAWETVEAEVIPKILRTKQAGDSMRMWVAGCATGEEAYTLAMLCAEAVFGHMEVPQVQIFATDIDEEAIAHAREAFYTLNDAADLPPERLARFFVQEQGGYRLRREVREMVMFATHNLVKDPPFSHLDLVACRNLLIYLNRSAQERALATFHFALNPGGYLFLGSSESVDGRADLFAALGTDQHIFRSRPASGRSYPVPELATSYTLAPLRLQSGGASGEVRQRERITFAELHQQLLEAYAPPSLVVDEEFDIVHLSPQAGRYLRLAGGEPTMNLLKVAREEIRLELRSALYHAQQTRSPVTAHDLPVHGDEGEEHIDIRVRPVLHPDDPARGFMLVLFAPSAAPLPPQPRPALPAPPITRQLEDEVGRLKAELRTSAQHHELQADKLKASNEELQAINEELRSSAEELETSKEELKIDELAHTSNDLQNLIKSTNIATLFLDRTFHVKLFTPTARELFNLIPADVGRPLSDITTRLLDTDLPEHVEAVLRDLQAIEREVRTTGGGVYMMRVLPYRTNEDLIAGVVVTFIDITQRKQAEERLRASEADFRASFEVSSVGEAICDGADAHIVRANPALCAMAGYECDELQDRPITALAHPEDAPAFGRAIEALASGSLRDYRAEVRFARRDGGEFWGDVAANMVRTVVGQPARILVVVTDITERRRAVEALSRSREELERRVSERTAELAAANELLRQEALERDRAEQARLQLARQLADAQENERRRLSRELHDQLGQEVSAITLKLAMLKTQPDLPPRAVEEIRQIESVAKQIDSDLDFLVWELRPIVLDDLGLAEALADYLGNWSSHFRIEAHMHGTGTARRVERDVETALYRIAQEALNNIAKHSGAAKVELRLDWTASQVRLTIGDNGKGFDAEAAVARGGGLGLVGMRERAAVVGGTFSIESSAGRGTSLQVRVPVVLDGPPLASAS